MTADQNPPTPAQAAEDTSTASVSDPRPGPTTPPANATADKRNGGGAGLWLAVLDLLVIIGLAAAGYLALQGFENQRHLQQQKLDGLDQRVNQLDVRHQGREQWFADIDEKTRAALRDVGELQRARRDAEQRAGQIDQALALLSTQVQGGQQAWQRAEVEHLLLVANTRLQLQGDVDGAATALRLADQRLAQMANPAYFKVRERIASELSRLEAVPRLDVQALALKLASLAEQVDALAIRTPRVGVFETQLSLQSAALELPWYQKLWAALGDTVDGLVTVHRDEERREPLLSPDQGVFLRLNLRLQLESARVAALRGDAANFDTALGQAASWLQRYFDPQQTATAAALGHIRELRDVTLSPPLPDISGSLNALRTAEPEA